MKKIAAIALLACTLWACSSERTLQKEFADPSNQYRPQPLWHLNGDMTKEGIEKQIADAQNKSGYGGMTPLPVTQLAHWFDGHLCPGMTPEFLTPEYFALYKDMLSFSKKRGMQVVLYDDVDFPSGSAGGRLLKEYPEHSRKYLLKDEFEAVGPNKIEVTYPLSESQSILYVSALNPSTKQILDISGSLKDNKLVWQAPAGNWKVMAFVLQYNVGPPHGQLVDYMDPVAVEKVMEMTYAEYDKNFAPWFGNTIQKVFFDDVGFVNMEQTWSAGISDRFEKKTGKNPALYYPALYYDIGPETAAARVAFHDARAELLAEGYVKQISEWCAARGLKSMGHPPGNYSPNTVVTCGDVLKLYRHVQIPLMDLIFGYGHGRDGYKQITSAADIGDKGIVGAEIYGAFPGELDSLTMYRTIMEAIARGVNFVVPHGLWYDPAPENVRIPPLVSWDNPMLGGSVHKMSDFSARSCVMLQDGRRVTDVGLLWPVTAVMAESWMFRDANSGLEVSTWLPANVNNMELSRLLTDALRRDFTYVHPEDLVSGKVSARGAELVLNNAVNKQNYKVLIMPGGDVIGADALKAIKAYYDGGGKVIATVNLPSRSAEFGRDSEVQKTISEIFPMAPAAGTIAQNAQGGCFGFLPAAGQAQLADMLQTMGIAPDVAFGDVPATAPVGRVNYIHKQKEGREIYYFTNTTDAPLAAKITLRGHVHAPELWDPHTGKTQPLAGVEYVQLADGSQATLVPLNLDAVRSTFIVSNPKQ